MSRLARSRPPSASLSHTISASQCISTLAWSRPPCASLCSTYSRPPSASLGDSIMASEWISTLAQSPPPSASHSLTWTWPASASPNLLDHCLQVYLCVQLDLGLQVHLETHSITPSMCIIKFAQSPPPSVSLSSLDCHLQAHLELFSSYACSQSRYTMCRLVAI